MENSTPRTPAIYAAIEAQVAFYQKRIEALGKIRLMIEAYGLEDEADITIYGAQLDLNHCSRGAFNRIRRKLPKGLKWNRRTDSNGLHYTTNIDGVVVRFWATELPPSCRLETEEVLVPAHTEKRLKVVCKEDNNEPKTSNPDDRAVSSADDVAF